MSGSIGPTVCPECGGQAVEFSENWEEVISCPYCGYFKRIREVGCIMPGIGIDGGDEYDITDEMFSCARCGKSEEGHFPSKKRGIHCEVKREGEVFYRVHEETSLEHFS